MNRAYSTIEIKAMTEAGGKRKFSGIASTPSTDRMGDVIDPKGAQFKLPLPLLWQHDSHDPIGWVNSAKVTDNGIEVECEMAELPDAADDDELKKRLNKAWQMLKAKLVRGLSIGFNSLESARIDNSYGIHFQKWEWLELSAVTIPANQDCSITSIKSIDQRHLAALGRQGPPVIDTSPGASGQSKQAASGRLFSSRSLKGNIMKTITQLREERALKADRLKELAALFETKDYTPTDEDGAEFDTLTDECKALDTEIRVASFHAMQGAAAKGVDGSSQAAASRSRGGMSFVKTQDPDDAFKGQSYVRGIIARAAAFAAMKNGNFISPADIAQHRWGKSHPKLVAHIRAAVAGGGTGSGEWGAELAQSDARYNGDFVEFLYSMTVFDRLPLRSVPARVHIKGQDGAATGYWYGESKAVPVSKPDFSDVELTPLKVGALAVCSKELIMDSDPSAEMWIRDSIAQASAQRVDTTFLGSAAAVSGVSPAGLLNGLSALAPSGTDAAAVRADMMSLYSSFLTAKNASGLVQVMTPSMAKALALLVNALGQPEFVGLNAGGGTLLGDTVYTGDNVTPGDWILLKPSDIWKIGDTGVEVSMSDTATIEQDSAPAGEGDTPTAASATLMSLWQTDQVGFKVMRRINYAKRRTSAVAVLSNAEYGGVVS
jgi:HK97 family phage prohead protease